MKKVLIMAFPGKEHEVKKILIKHKYVPLSNEILSAELPSDVIQALQPFARVEIKQPKQVH